MTGPDRQVVYIVDAEASEPEGRDARASMEGLRVILTGSRAEDRVIISGVRGRAQAAR